MEERMEEAERELDELEHLHEEPGKSSKSETIRVHSRNASNVSTLSNTSELIADPEDDGGYGSVRHVPNWSDSEDVDLVLKLQQRLKTVEKDKASLATRVEELERESPTADVRRAQDMIRLQMKLAKKVKQEGVPAENQEASSEVHETVHSSRRNERSESLPVVRKKETNYLGMFDFNVGDEKQIARNLVYELKPRVASTLLPGLPAYIIFMCVRHADYINDDEKIRSFLTLIINAIHRLIKKRYEDLDTSVVWLVNTCRLLHSLKQYSGEKTFKEKNTAKQNEQCLRNFELSDYRQVLSDVAVWIYQAVIKFMEERVQKFIVTAVLEHEVISGLQMQPVEESGRARSGSARDTTSPGDPQEAIAHLLRELTIFHQVLKLYGVDPTLIAQAFRQVFYYICACALNNLLLRKEMCHWSKGIQIQCNISRLEQWLRDQDIHGQETMSACIVDTLQPIIQAAWLLHFLQARKSDDAVRHICTMCSRLTSAQIIKILNLYTPADELGDRIPISFIRKVLEELEKRTDPQSQSKLLMDTNHAFTVRFPYSPSSINLEDIDIPTVLNLPMLKKV